MSTTSNRIRTVLGDRVLFHVERSTDNHVVIYEALREGNVLNPPFVDLYWSKKRSLSTRSEVGSKAREYFFGIKARKKSLGKYDMIVAAIPSRMIHVSLKKSGKCVAKTVIEGKMCKMDRILLTMGEMSAFGIPYVDEITVFGTFNGAEVSETIVVTEEMKKKFSLI